MSPDTQLALQIVDAERKRWQQAEEHCDEHQTPDKTQPGHDELERLDLIAMGALGAIANIYVAIHLGKPLASYPESTPERTTDDPEINTVPGYPTGTLAKLGSKVANALVDARNKLDQKLRSMRSSGKIGMVPTVHASVIHAGNTPIGVLVVNGFNSPSDQEVVRLTSRGCWEGFSVILHR